MFVRHSFASIYFSTLLPFITPDTLLLLCNILYFNSIRAWRGSKSCLAASIPLFSLHRPGILAYHCMEWNTRRLFAPHHFNSIHTEPGALCLSGYTCTTILLRAFGTRNNDLYGQQPQAGHHHSPLSSRSSTTPIPLSSTRRDRYLSRLPLFPAFQRIPFTAWAAFSSIC